MMNEDRLYRALDKILPHKEALEEYLKESAGSLFDLDYELFLYDVTSTYFEGEALGNPRAQRGYSRDHRSDVTTVEEIVEVMEGRYGKANRIWLMVVNWSLSVAIKPCVYGRCLLTADRRLWHGRSAVRSKTAAPTNSQQRRFRYRMPRGVNAGSPWEGF